MATSETPAKVVEVEKDQHGYTFVEVSGYGRYDFYTPDYKDKLGEPKVGDKIILGPGRGCALYSLLRKAPAEVKAKKAVVKKSVAAVKKAVESKGSKKREPALV